MVLADLEVELALQPDRFALGDPLLLPVEAQRLAGAVAELQLVVAGAEAGAPPAGLEEAVQLPQPVLALGGRILVEAFEDVVDEDPEALVDGRLLGDPEDAGELVLERAGQVQRQIRGGEAEATVAAARQEGRQ